MNGAEARQRLALGLDHLNHGRLDAAEAALRAVVSADPRNTDALHLLAIVGYRRGHAHGAIPLLRRAVTIQPGFASAWNTLGECYRAIGQRDPAAAAYRRSIELSPALAAAHSNLALVLLDAGQTAAAIEAARAALALDPELVSAYSTLGQALRMQGDPAGGLEALQRAVERGPADPVGHNNLGVALESLDRLPEALDAYRKAAELAPDLAVACNNYLNVARQLNRWDEAIAWTQRALSANPSFAPARWNLGLLQLTMGDYANGLPNYELRFTATEQRHPPGVTGRAWDGREDLAGRTLLLYAEQGFGDGFQAARYVPVVAGRAGRVVLFCHPEQARLFARLPGVSAVVAGADSLPAYDRFAALMSLPYLCGTRSLQAIPRAVPYLSPPPDVADRWRSRMAPLAGPKVGLVWAGKPNPDPLRTIPLADLAPLLAVPGVRWFSLQLGAPAVDLARVAGREGVTDLSPDLTDFAETAAAMEQLDLFITIDSAVAHLSGALGRPTWTLLPFSPDWRWLLDRADSPWYPTMRLFRQTERKQWGSVIDRVAADLRDFIDPQPRR